MKKQLVMTMYVVSLIGLAVRAETCLDAEKLVKLDAQYENALQTGDAQFLDKLLAPEFYWVHNLASLKEKKAELLVRVQKPEERVSARRAHDITLHRLANTVVLQGLSSVDKWNADGKTVRTSRYQFMRTYVEHNSECKLLAVQTMKVWSSEGN
jgi:Tfp pilus assembly protein PilN